MLLLKFILNFAVNLGFVVGWERLTTDAACILVNIDLLLQAPKAKFVLAWSRDWLGVDLVANRALVVRNSRLC